MLNVYLVEVDKYWLGGRVAAVRPCAFSVRRMLNERKTYVLLISPMSSKASIISPIVSSTASSVYKKTRLFLSAFPIVVPNLSW
jgi:hypothetical protein